MIFIFSHRWWQLWFKAQRRTGMRDSWCRRHHCLDWRRWPQLCNTVGGWGDTILLYTTSIIRPVRLSNPYNLSTPNQGSLYNLSPHSLSKANQSKKAVRTICLQTKQSFYTQLPRTGLSVCPVFSFTKFWYDARPIIIIIIGVSIKQWWQWWL